MSPATRALPEDVFIGRQPICDRALGLRGYELLYRTGDAPTAAAFADGDRASATVAVNSILEVGLHTLVGEHLAFLNVTRGFLVERHFLALPAERVVLEVLEDVVPDAELLEVLAEARHCGFRIALDDVTDPAAIEPLLGLADIVKVDVADLDRRAVADGAQALRAPRRVLLAEKVESHEDFELCREAGYDWFQGFFLCRPNVVRARGLPTNRLSLLQLMARVQDPRTGLPEIAELIERDVALSYRLLRYLNCAVFSLPHRIESIRQALVLLGANRVRSCITLLLMTRVGDKPRELMEVAVVRARVCQLLAKDAYQRRQQTFFSVGLLSVLDALLDLPMEDCLREIPLSEEIRAALLEGTGDAGRALQAALAGERGAFDETARTGHPPTRVHAAQLDALAFAAEALPVLTGA